MLAAGNNRAFAKVCEALGKPELTEDPRFIDNSATAKPRRSQRAYRCAIGRSGWNEVRVGAPKVVACYAWPVLDTG